MKPLPFRILYGFLLALALMQPFLATEEVWAVFLAAAPLVAACLWVMRGAARLSIPGHENELRR